MGDGWGWREEGEGGPPPAPQGPAASGARSHQERELFDANYFLNYMEGKGNTYQQHNQALKWWRYVKEDLAEPFRLSSPKVFDNAQPTWGAVCDHRPGTSFGFASDRVPWRWQEMVATLRDEDICEVVGGPRGDAALVGCSLEVRPNSYDHARSHALAKQQRVETKLPMWDFVLHRDDGTGVRLHPNWGNRKVIAFAFSPHADTVKSPIAGLGQSDGRGTFRYYGKLGVQRTYHFDAAKEKQAS